MRTSIIILFNMVLLLAAEPCFTQTWLPVGPGIGCIYGEWVEDIYVSGDNSKLLIAGSFSEDGNCDSMRTVLTWDVQQFYQTAEHGPLGNIRSDLVFEHNGNTYCHGNFVPYDGARLNVLTPEGIWSPIPNGIQGLLQDYCIHNGVVYISGALHECGGVPCSLVCTFDGEQALPYYTGAATGSHTYSVKVYQDTVFIGGIFGGPDGLNTQGYNKCCKVVNGQLEKVAQGFSGSGVISDMEEYDGKLFIAGGSSAHGISGWHSIYYYENGQLHTLPAEPNMSINALKAYNGGLYAAGDFTQIGGVPCNNVARWDGHTWTCLNNETLLYTWYSVKDIEVWNDMLYIGGGFFQMGDTELKRIAKLDMALSEAFPVNITEQQKQEVKMSVYPNPANDKLNIQLDKPSVVSVYTATGQLLETHTSKSTYQIDVSHYPAGLYLVVSGGLSKRFVRE